MLSDDQKDIVTNILASTTRLTELPPQDVESETGNGYLYDLGSGYGDRSTYLTRNDTKQNKSATPIRQGRVY